MQSKSDVQLLRDYAQSGAEGAFAEIVQRHTNLVYSAALRQVNIPETAAEITQSVFVGLAQGAKATAHRFPEEASLAGWLCRSARNQALNFRRDEFRRHSRERLAMELLDPLPASAPDWENLRPVLDAAMAELPEADYDALVLRFFKNHDLRAVGRSLGISDDTAQKRVARALEKLRAHLARRGVTTTAAALSLVISANAVQAAPVGLAAAISTIAGLTGATLASAATATAVKTIVMTTLQKSIIAVAFVAAVGTSIYEVRENSRLRNELQTFQQQNTRAVEQNPATDRTVESAEMAVVPAKAPATSDPVEWTARLAALNGGDWRQAFALGQKLAALPPNAGFAILEANWASITNVSARQQLLKAFDFAQHERLPAALELALLDPSTEVQGWALTYLKEVALKDFSADYPAGVAWLAAHRELSLSAAFTDALWQFANNLRIADPETARQQLEILQRAGQLLEKFPEVVKSTGMGQTFAELINSNDSKLAKEALRAARNLSFGDEWVRNVVLPKLSTDNPAELREAAAGVLAAPGREWAVQPLLDTLAESVRSGQGGFGLPHALADVGSPKAIPTMIALIEADNTYDTVYGIGYYGLGKMTGVTYDEKHDGAWWRQWWENNKQRFPADVQAMPIPRFEPVKRPAVSSSKSPAN